MATSILSTLNKPDTGLTGNVSSSNSSTTIKPLPTTTSNVLANYSLPVGSVPQMNTGLQTVNSGKTITAPATYSAAPATERATLHDTNVATMNAQQETAKANAAIAAANNTQKPATGTTANFNPAVSIVDYLSSKGQPSTFNARAELAKNSGISNYTGTAAQNAQLLGILQNAPVKKEPTVAEIAIRNVGTTPTTTPTNTLTTTTTTGSQNLDAYNLAQKSTFDDIEQAHSNFIQQMADATAGKLNANEQAQVDLINQQFESLRQQQIVANKNNESASTQIGIASGRQRYAPDVQLGIIQGVINTGIAKLTDVTNKQIQTVLSYKQAVQDRNYKVAESLWKEEQDYTKEKQSHLKDIYDKTVAFEKQIRDQNVAVEKMQYERVTKPIQDIMGDAAKNGADANTLAAIKNANSVEGAMAAAGNYLQTGSGIVGEYQFYARQEQQAGRTPLSFNAYQTLDQNRKIAVAKAATAPERKSNAYGSINQLMNMRNSAGMPYLDANGYFTAQGFKDIVNNAIEDGISKKDIIEQYGSFLSPTNLDNYGLTAKDKKDLGVTSE